MKDKEFNVTQGMAWLFLKPLNLPVNYVLNLVVYIINPSNNIGYYDPSQTGLVLLQPAEINFFHSSLALSTFNSSLVIIRGGSFPKTPRIFPESINIYSKNLSLF